VSKKKEVYKKKNKSSTFTCNKQKGIMHGTMKSLNLYPTSSFKIKTKFALFCM
jgi:hypothetical protein